VSDGSCVRDILRPGSAQLVSDNVLRGNKRHLPPTAFVGQDLDAVRSYEKVEVFRSARLGVNSYRVASNDKVLNAMFVECGQEFFEVLAEHRALIPSIGAA
jgi:hypothetical protein